MNTILLISFSITLLLTSGIVYVKGSLLRHPPHYISSSYPHLSGEKETACDYIAQNCTFLYKRSLHHDSPLY